MKKLFKRHYQAIVKRGLITDETDIGDFIDKMYEELQEIDEARRCEDIVNEIIDLMCVCTNTLIKQRVDIEKELLKNVLIQEKRANEKK